MLWPTFMEINITEKKSMGRDKVFSILYMFICMEINVFWQDYIFRKQAFSTTRNTISNGVSRQVVSVEKGSDLVGKEVIPTKYFRGLNYNPLSSIVAIWTVSHEKKIQINLYLW